MDFSNEAEFVLRNPDLGHYQWARIGVKGLLFREGKVLLLHRRNDLDLHPGLWDLPGGAVEKGDGLEGALVREFQEETGLKVEVRNLVHVWLTPAQLRSGDTFHGLVVCFACHSESNHPPKIDPQEHTEYRWVSRDELAQLSLIPDQQIALQKGFSPP